MFSIEFKKSGIPKRNRALDWLFALARHDLWNEKKRDQFFCLGKGKRNYTSPQKDYVLSLIDTCGVRAASRILQIPRRTIQRWCRRYGVRVRRCPAWVYDWAERRRIRREFWQRRGY